MPKTETPKAGVVTTQEVAEKPSLFARFKASMQSAFQSIKKSLQSAQKSIAKAYHKATHPKDPLDDDRLLNTMAFRKPRIGISMRVQPPLNAAPKDVIMGQHFLVHQAEKDAIKKAGGSTYILQHKRSLIPFYVRMMDGLVLSGNTFDIADSSKITKAAKKRLVFEMELATAMIKAGKPVMGMCGGMQMAVKLMGGQLYEDIPTQVKTTINHSAGPNYRDPAHSITILDPQSAIGRAARGATQTHVNSIHHQGISFHQLPKGVVPTAVAPDNVVEAIELRDAKGKTIFFGTQFHPELRNDTGIIMPQDKDKPLTPTDKLGQNLYAVFMERVREGAVKPELTKGLVKHIKSLGVVDQVKDTSFIGDHDLAKGIMPPSKPSVTATVVTKSQTPAPIAVVPPAKPVNHAAGVVASRVPVQIGGATRV